MTTRIKSVATLWLMTIVIGLGMLSRYQNTPGVAAAATASWPGGTSLAQTSARPTLLMFLHPHCACSNASITELKRILTLAPDRAEARVIFFNPTAAGSEWGQTSLFKAAKEIPGVEVIADHDGALAKQFGAVTSGQVFLYSPNGRLLFSGGITGARAHEGDNAGETTVANLLLELDAAPQAIEQTSVYGCPILDVSQTPQEVVR